MPAYKTNSAAIPNATTSCARRQHLDHRETSDAYRGVVLCYGSFRIATCRDGLQWLFQRKRPGFPGGGAAWDTLGYCMTRVGLMRLHRAHIGGEVPEIEALPETFKSGGRDG